MHLNTDLILVKLSEKVSLDFIGKYKREDLTHEGARTVQDVRFSAPLGKSRRNVGPSSALCPGSSVPDSHTLLRFSQNELQIYYF